MPFSFPKSLALFCVWMLLICAIPQQASTQEITVDIVGGQIRSIPIAVTLSAGDASPQSMAQRQFIEDLIARDLEWSGVFALGDPRAFPRRGNEGMLQPEFDAWQAIQMQALVTGAVTIEAPDENGIAHVDLTLRLWNVLTEELLLNKGYRTRLNNWRRLTHIAADDIFERMTGERGYFDTRIVFVAEEGPRNNRIRKLAIMDQDGKNLRYLTDGSYQVFSPRFSPDEQKITYMRIENDEVRSYILELASGKNQAITNIANMSFAQRFGHLDSYLLLTLSNEDNSDIYRYDMRSQQLSRLTFDDAIDVSPSTSPDGSLIAFTSDRGGSPQIYTMQANGNNIRRISFGNGYYSTPVWSPRGDLIAFTKQTEGLFFIGVMSPDGANERLLTSAYLAESPAWAPNGQRLIFHRQNSPNQDHYELYSIDILGLHGRTLDTPTNATDPAWSPHLPRK